MIIPELETERLRLVAPTSSHLNHYIEFFTNADASANYSGPLTEAQAWSRLAHDRGIWHLRGFGVWIVTSKQSNEVLGGCGYWQGHRWPRELTWWLMPSARGAGIAREASVAAIAHGYDEFGWDTVQTYMDDANDAARALAIRLGGREAGRHTFPDRSDRTVYVMPRTDGTYPAANLG